MPIDLKLPHEQPQPLQGIDRIPDDEWAFYKEVIEILRGTGEPFALGGAFAWAAYSGVYRNTKDLDIFILPETRQKLIDALSEHGITDYYTEDAYDRKWIYRGTRDGFIIDLIFDMANYRANLDPDWVQCGPTVDVRGELVKVLPAEELIWNKLYILQRPRCDWTDVLNLLYITVETLDWERLLSKVDPDLHLLGGVLSVFVWMCPGRATLVPEFVWQRVGMLRPLLNGDPDYIRHRVDLLDSRPWFLPSLEPGQEPFSPIVLNK